ncbi:MAG: hypothetical protein JO176_03690 [Acidimicrobiia bacterium]|nr:hypothetical protein [Acidimicrobiia bacterium]
MKTLHAMRAPVAAVAVVAAAIVVASLWSGVRAQPSDRSAPTASKVVVFGFSGLSWDDIRHDQTPNLRALVARGAVGAMTVRTVSRQPSAGEGYATLGAGARVKGPETEDASGGGVPIIGHHSPLTVEGARDLIAANRGRHLSTGPGALGDALKAGGHRVAIVGPAGPGAAPVEALAAMNSDGSLPEAWLFPAGSPAGSAPTDVGFLAALDDALARADAVFVDPGQTPASAGGQSDRSGRPARVEATDHVLGDLIGRLPAATRLVVISVVPPGPAWHLAPVVVAGAGVPHGYVDSPSTRRLGLVTLTDAAPEIVTSLGGRPPTAMIGRPFRYHPAQPDLARLAGLDRDGRARATTYFPIAVGFVVLHGIVYLLAAWCLAGRRRASRLRPFVCYGLLAIAAFPLATYLLRVVPPAVVGGWAAVALLGLDALLVMVASRARTHALAPLLVLSALTVVLLIGDVATGARLQVNSILGYAPLTADRFYGIGGTTLGVLVAATLVAAALYVQLSQRTREALVVVAATFVVVVVVAGAPVLGAKVGSILTMAPVFVVTFAALAGTRPSWKTIVVAVGVTVLVLAGASAVELLRPAATRSHLGELVGSTSANGGGSLLTVIVRKASTDARVFVETVWSWLALIVTVFVGYLLVRDHRFRRILPVGSPMRVGALALVGAGVVGLAVNDTGIIITALVLVYLGPYLALSAIDTSRRREAVAAGETAAPVPAALGTPST